MVPALITQAATPDYHVLGGVIGTAFAEDPIAGWIFREPAEIVHTFRHLARHIYLPRGHCHVAAIDGGVVGGAMWLAPHASPALTVPATVSIAAAALLRARFSRAGMARLIRALRVDTTMQRHHPREPHFYLFAVGVLPTARGRGVARQLLAPVLSRCDAERTPAYLENSNAKNTHLYESLGFVARLPFVPAAGCPPMTPMWRAPR